MHLSTQLLDSTIPRILEHLNNPENKAYQSIILTYDKLNDQITITLSPQPPLSTFHFPTFASFPLNHPLPHIISNLLTLSFERTLKKEISSDKMLSVNVIYDKEKRQRAAKKAWKTKRKKNHTTNT